MSLDLRKMPGRSVTEDGRGLRVGLTDGETCVTVQ